MSQEMLLYDIVKQALSRYDTSVAVHNFNVDQSTTSINVDDFRQKHTRRLYVNQGKRMS